MNARVKTASSAAAALAVMQALACTGEIAPGPAPAPDVEQLELTSVPRNAFRGVYYDTADITSRTDKCLDAANDFGRGWSAPGSTMGVDTFSVRWVGDFDLTRSGTYRFDTSSDDGIRIWVVGMRILAFWS